MQKPQILSSPPRPAPKPRETTPPAPVVFDACHAGVVLRAVLFVETVLGVGAAFGSHHWAAWLLQLALLTGAALPATLAWLLIACSLKRWLQRLGLPGQWAAGVLLGALAGWFACAMLHWMEIAPQPAPWLASAASGALLAAALVAALVLRAQARTPAATTARLTELQARIRPHFLFNTLNSAIALVRDEPAKAEALLEDLSDLFRSALTEQGEAVTLEEEITLAQRYIAIEQVRFGPRLQVQWQLDPQAGSALLPPLLLQPLVENAVKHGVEPCPQGGQVRVRTKRRGSWVRVRISNTLPLPDPSGHAPPPSTLGHGIALANVRARLLLLHDVQCSFSAGIHGPTYQVCITLPANG
ncbi:MAG: histidine kinase [Giesbergeria sp.]|uniref:sensor histidine kinase n=1 Tax=Giesbergeria sp. TaxID=2818473 RepID=UPI0026214A8E|nr:histidine kinase [Giesbergeria sp.]MDD2608752.1 histidine kinase [Giesbergeria sp.]